MPERLNVYLPDDLHRALDRYRDRLNVSRICQEALAREVARLEAAAADAEDSPMPRLDAQQRDALVARLRQERSRRRKFWYDLGYRVAFAWARDEAGPGELRALAAGAGAPGAMGIKFHWGSKEGPAAGPQPGPVTLSADMAQRVASFEKMAGDLEALKTSAADLAQRVVSGVPGPVGAFAYAADRGAAERAWHALRRAALDAARASGSAPPEDEESLRRGVQDAAGAVWEAVGAALEAEEGQ